MRPLLMLTRDDAPIATPPRAVSASLVWLDDADPLRRIAATNALATAKGDGITARLHARVDDADRRVRAAALTVLATRGDRTVVADLVTRLLDPRARSRPGIARALGNLGDSSVLPALRGVLNDSDSHLREEARTALRRFDAVVALELPADPAFTRRVAHRLARLHRPPFAGESPAHVLLSAALQRGGALADAAEAWLATGGPDWLWLRRVGPVPLDHVVAVREQTTRGEPAVVEDVLPLADGGIVVHSDLGVEVLHPDWSWRATLGPIRGGCRGIWLEGNRVVCLYEDGEKRRFDFDGRPVAPPGVREKRGRAGPRPERWRLCCDGGHLRVRHVITGGVRSVVAGPYEYVDGRLVDDNHAVAWTLDGRVVLLDLRNAPPPDDRETFLFRETVHAPNECDGTDPAAPTGHSVDIQGAVLVGDLAVSVAGDGTLRTWDLQTGAVVRVIRAHFGPVAEACVVGEHVISGGPDRWLRVWEPVSGELVGERQFDSRIGLLRAMPGRRVIVGYGVGEMALCDPLTEVGSLSFLGHEAPVVGARPLKDGSGVLTWSLDGTARVWGWNGWLLRTLRLAGPVMGAVELDEGRVLAWSMQAGWPGGVLWHLQNGNVIKRLTPDEARPLHPGFESPDVRQRAGWALRGGETVTLQQGAGARAAWHSEGQWRACALREDGVVVAVRGSELAVLHLWAGNRRVGLGEAKGAVEGRQF